MSENNVPVTVKIFDKEYRIACPTEEKQGLLTSAEFLNKRLKEIRQSGKVVAEDTALALAALNITHELLTQKWQQERTNSRISHLRDKTGSALDKDELSRKG